MVEIQEITITKFVVDDDSEFDTLEEAIEYARKHGFSTELDKTMP
jgi:hypothetical protein